MKKIKENKTDRLKLLDAIRGFTLINMILYHTLYDITMFTTKGLEWYDKTPGYIWQQAICWTFIFLSGMCRSMGKRHLKRGLIVSACGIVITLVTLIFMPEERIFLGILTFMGAAMLFVIPFEKMFRQMNPYLGMGVNAVLFFLTKDIYFHWLGFESIHLVKIPDFFYQNVITAFFGFPPLDFFSGDYFPFFPWIFLFLTGYFFWLAFGNKIKNWKIMKADMPGFEFLGRHSLLIYMLHQPICFGMVYFYFTYIRR